MLYRLYKQQHPNTCGISVAKNILKNKFKIHIAEHSLTKLAEYLYKRKNKPRLSQYYKIRDYGTDVYHFRNLANYFKLKAFSKSNGAISNIKYLIDKGIWPIIHRAYERDGEGHYLIVIDYDRNSILLFDPSRENDGLRIESHREFYRKWLFNRERWLIFFYKKGQVKMPFAGKYL